MKCAITGHRPKSFEFGYNEDDIRCTNLKEKIKTEILRAIDNGVDTFYTGGSLGVDTWAAEIVLSLKNDYDIRLILVLPGRTQHLKWPKSAQARYLDVIDVADEIIYMYNGPGFFDLQYMILRNEYLINNTDMLISVYNGKKSGTSNIVNFAIKQKKRIIYIPLVENPNQRGE